MPASTFSRICSPHLQSKCPNLACCFILHHDNTRPHTAKVMLQYLTAIKVKRLPHLPYNPDLATCDYWLFQKLKEPLRDQTFSTNKDILLACNQIFARILATKFAKTFQNWIEHWKQCIEVTVAILKKKFCKEQYIYSHYKRSFNLFSLFLSLY